MEVVELADSKDRQAGQDICLYSMGIAIAPATGQVFFCGLFPLHCKFWRTRIVTFSPRYVIINESSRDILLRQKNSAQVFPLLHNARIHYHWPESTGEKLLTITIPEEGHVWFVLLKKSFYCSRSGSFSVDTIGTFSIKVRTALAVHLISVMIKAVDATLLVCFIPKSKQLPPYRIENNSLYTVIVHQQVQRGFLYFCNCYCRKLIPMKPSLLFLQYLTHG